MMINLIQDLKKKITGEVVFKTDSMYDHLAFSYKKNGQPLAIVCVKNNGDIVKTLEFAKRNNLLLSVRSGGHSMIGASTNHGGVILDLRQLNTIEVIDEEKSIVRIGSGAHWGDVAKELEKAGLVISSGDTNQVGVGGLTLGGGIGWMVRKYGLTIDSMIGAELVTATGQILQLNDKENPDLFWAIRGGGGNFGVVTHFDFIAHPCKGVFGGNIVFDVIDREKVLGGWTAFMKTAPNELTSTLLIMPGFDPKDPTPMMIISICYDSVNENQAQKVIKPLLQLGKIKSNDCAVKKYYQMLQDAPSQMPFKVINNIAFVKNMDEFFVKKIAANFGQLDTPLIQLRSLGGAVNKISEDDTAFAHRDYEAMMSVATFISSKMSEEEAEKKAKQAWEPVKEFAEGSYSNFLTDSLDKSVHAAYPTKTYQRLAQIKSVYDPNNLFNQNINIKPLHQ